MQKHQPYINKRIVFVLIMAMITTILISFALIAINVGFVRNFLMIWLQSWCISYFMAVSAMLFIGPKVQSILDSVLK